LPFLALVEVNLQIMGLSERKTENHFGFLLIAIFLLHTSTLLAEEGLLDQLYQEQRLRQAQEKSTTLYRQTLQRVFPNWGRPIGCQIACCRMGEAICLDFQPWVTPDQA
jgi:hypothetical protein